MKKQYAYPVHAILLLGPTGAGKTPLGDVIAKKGLFDRTCRHLDFGSELRGAVSERARAAAYTDGELRFIHGVLERGLLLENEHFPLAQKIISLFLDRTGFSQPDVLVLNGMPRHLGQARDMETLAHIHSIVVLDCTADDVFYRIRDNVGGDRTERIDDEKKLIEKKLFLFRDRTAPLIQHFTAAGNAVYRLRIGGTTNTDQAYEQLLLLSAAHPPVTLIAEPPE